MSDTVRTFSSAGRLVLSRLRAFGSRRSHEDQAAAIGPRGGLFRKYVLLIVGLVSLVLLLNSALDFWFGYEENKAALFRIQQEKAASAARRIEEFVDEIERQLGWTTAPQWAAAPLEQRRFDYVRLLRQVPPITELIQLDDNGKEQLKVSRLAIDVVGSEKDYSEAPSFIEARKHRVWFSPVYFRKESEPYMTLAMARTGRNAGVTVAEVNLKLIWDVITGLKIGQGGYAYVVDREGRLIAHPDISLVLRNTDLAALPQVAAARAEAAGDKAESAGAMVAKGINGDRVLTAHAAIAPLGWTVFVELPLREALAPLYGSALRTAALLALALVLATSAALLLARRMTVPIRQLQAGAARIGAGELDRRIDIHTGDELEGLAGDFNRMAADLQKSYTDLEKKVEDRTAELTEALDQQTATSEVLGVINSSPGDLTPVFDAMLEKAMRLCDASFGSFANFDGEFFTAVAHRNVPPELIEALREPMPLTPGGHLMRIGSGESVVPIVDFTDTDAYRSGKRWAVALVDKGGARSAVWVALRRDEALLGVLVIYRRDVRPFTDKQIALLQNFAAQAVIAIENARLLTETREALEQQTATAEVLGVINSSPGDLAPVFDAMLEKAMRLCEAEFGLLTNFDGEAFHAAALRGVPTGFAESWREPRRPSPGLALYQLTQGENLVHVADVTAEDAYRSGNPIRRALADLGGARTGLWVALQKDALLLGAFVIYRKEVRPFSDKQIALLQNFAAQAVIAMENARLITETREALEQQTATAEVLQVINSSPGNLGPVFDAMLEKARRLCEADVGSFWSCGGQNFQVLASTVGCDVGRTASPDPGTSLYRIARGESVVQIADVTKEEAYRAGVGQERTRRAGTRTALAVALRKDDALIGAITAGRREVRPFSDKQIALLQNFAAQAVIAMENARLITETREALEQQTATAEVLQVINSSPGDLAPVFDAMLEKATRLCDAGFGILWTYNGECLDAVAMRGVPAAFVDFAREPLRPGPNTGLGQVLRGEHLVHIADIKAGEAYRSGDRLRVATVEAAGARTLLLVPLRKEDALLGIFSVYRQEVRPFSDKQIALLQNFAAQAVIAMENARLITETHEALEQQTATAEVLGVINSSPSDLAPVFNAILEKAHGLCGITFGTLQLYDGEKLRAVATRGLPEPQEKIIREPYTPDLNSPLQGLIDGGRLVQFPDLAERDTQVPNPRSRVAVDLGIRTLLFLPLRKENRLLGLISAARKEAKLFSEREIALLENFAAQAVIAMENARLITETREALEQQTATAEVLQVINSSPGDLAPVYDVILEKAHSLCGIAYGGLCIYDGEYFRAVAIRGYPEQFAEVLRRPFRGNAFHQRLVRGERYTHIPDTLAVASLLTDSAGKGSIDVGVRTNLMVPLRKDNTLLGHISASRGEVRPFSEKEIALLENFAAQAVIAMENARLIRETREALEQQTATAEVLQVINSSPSDLTPVFSAILEKAHGLCGVTLGTLQLYDGEKFRAVATRGLPQPLEKVIREPYALELNSPLLGLINGGRFVQIRDLAEHDIQVPNPRSRVAVDLGMRTLLFLPLRRDNHLLGLISAARTETKLFSEREIVLLENFAAQAVIAMENARLITETRESLEYQTATSDVLRVVSRSAFELETVLQAVVTTAIRLCRADSAVIYRNDDGEYRWAAGHMLSPEYEEIERNVRIQPGTGTVVGRAALEGATVQVLDAWTDPLYEAKDDARVGGVHTMIGVPLLREGAPIGVIGLARRRVEAFSEREIQLVTTFADQAVIAIENARLITELRQRTRDLQESLEYQTATSEVLKVISRSAFDLQPVLHTVAETAARLCESEMAFILRRDGEVYRAAAALGWSPEYKEYLESHPIVPSRETLTGRVVLEGRAVQIADIATDPEYTLTEATTLGDAHTQLGVPLLREDVPIGVIILSRRTVRPFSEKQVELVTTFADQAVIAIENARLLNDLQQRTHDLQESLEYQTATSDVLKVISQSTFDLQPVLDTLLETAVRLCEADKGMIYRASDAVYRLASSTGFPAEYTDFITRNPITPSRGTLVGRTVIEGKVVHIEDRQTDPQYTWAELQRRGQVHTLLGVPLFREDAVVGVITLGRERIQPFTDKQIAAARTFADQAVIAVENARLFNELRARTTELGSSVAELKMLNEVAQAVSSTLDLRTVLSTVLNASLGVTWANAGAVFRYSRAERAFRLVEAVGWDEPLLRSVRDLRVAEAETAMGEAAARRTPIQLAELAERPSAPLRDASLAAGFHSALIVPLVGAERVLGAIILMRQEAGEFPSETVRLMQTLASQSVLAIQNARLFREIADKSEQLALASQHKSQFLANMSHELRTPLNAILGYAELLVDGIYGVLPDRPKGVLERIQNNGKHLLALINDVLDLAKIEAGQLILTLEDYSLPEVLQSVVTATEPLATSKGLKFTAAVQDDLPMAHGDARRVSQVLLNLVGNAIKFTDEGEVEIGANLDKGQFVLTVRDTGPGIPDADQERIFGEFQQIDNSNTRKKGGTGLGLAISKRMVEMQGGTISVDSVLGQGSTFRVVLPVHVDEMMEAA